MIRAALILVALSLGAASAQTPSARAEQAAEALIAAGERLRDSGSAENQVAALSNTIKAYETGLSALRASLREVTLNMRDLEAELEIDSELFSGFVGALVAMSRAPDAQSVLHPDGMLGTVRAGMVMADLTPAIEARASRLKSQISELGVLRDVQKGALSTLEDGLRGVEAARTALAQAASANRSAPSPTDQAALQAILNGAETLSGFAQSLGSTEGQEITGFESQKGQLRLLTRADVLTGYKETDVNGVVRNGTVLGTLPRASVAAPFASSVRYSGPFLDIGQVVILEPQSDYLIILAGLAETYVSTGEVLDNGALVGMMGGENPTADEILNGFRQSGAIDRTEKLYVEVRSGDETLDPEEWFGFEED